MEKEVIIKEGYKLLDAGNLQALLHFITKDAVIDCDIYGNLPLALFFKTFLADTLNLTTTVKRITHQPVNSNFVTAVVAFSWTLKDQQVIKGDALLFFILMLITKFLIFDAPIISCSFLKQHYNDQARKNSKKSFRIYTDRRHPADDQNFYA